MAPILRFGVVHDFRSPPGSEVTLPDVYAQVMDQVALVDQLGFDLVWFTEHHFLDDGHLPSFVPVAGAVAARTKNVRISTDICLLPFAHPVRLAELGTRARHNPCGSSPPNTAAMAWHSS